MMDFVLDFGNARIKWFDPRSGVYEDCRHAIVALSETDWRRVVKRGRPPQGLVKINGAAFAIGDAARRYIIPERPRGASRYRDTYYGVGMAYALSEGFQRSIRNVTLIAGYAPGDVDYVPNLVTAARGQWTVESQYGTSTFNVTNIIPFDEPLGGFSHYTLTQRGTEKKRNELANEYVLVVDVGGYTCDVAAIDPGGVIDVSSLHSTRTGVLNMLEDFEQQLRGNNATLFQDTGDIDVRRLEQSLLSGVFQFGNTEVDCSYEARDAIHSLTNDVVQVINAAGGVANFPYMLLTGGGPGLIYEALELSLSRANFRMAEKQRPLMKYANAFGGANLAAMLRNMGVM